MAMAIWVSLQPTGKQTYIEKLIKTYHLKVFDNEMLDSNVLKGYTVIVFIGTLLKIDMINTSLSLFHKPSVKTMKRFFNWS